MTNRFALEESAGLQKCAALVTWLVAIKPHGVQGLGRGAKA